MTLSHSSADVQQYVIPRGPVPQGVPLHTTSLPPLESNHFPTPASGPYNPVPDGAIHGMIDMELMAARMKACYETWGAQYYAQGALRAKAMQTIVPILSRHFIDGCLEYMEEKQGNIDLNYKISTMPEFRDVFQNYRESVVWLKHPTWHPDPQVSLPPHPEVFLSGDMHTATPTKEQCGDARDNAFVAMLYTAIVDMDCILDKTTTGNKINKVVVSRYSPIFITAACWKVYNKVKKLHSRGQTFSRVTVDPTFEVCTDEKHGYGNEKDPKGLYRPRKKAEQGRFMTLEQRWVEICISAKFCKAVASDLLDGTSIARVILDPKKSRETKADNSKNNKSKKDLLNLGQATYDHVTAQRESGDTPSTKALNAKHRLDAEAEKVTKSKAPKRSRTKGPKQTTITVGKGKGKALMRRKSSLTSIATEPAMASDEDVAVFDQELYRYSSSPESVDAVLAQPANSPQLSGPCQPQVLGHAPGVLHTYSSMPGPSSISQAQPMPLAHPDFEHGYNMDNAFMTGHMEPLSYPNHMQSHFNTHGVKHFYNAAVGTSSMQGPSYAGHHHAIAGSDARFGTEDDFGLTQEANVQKIFNRLSRK